MKYDPLGGAEKGKQEVALLRKREMGEFPRPRMEKREMEKERWIRTGLCGGSKIGRGSEEEAENSASGDMVTNRGRGREEKA